MFLTRYDYTGNTDSLVEAHDRMLAVFPPEILDLHVLIRTTDGITVLDGCPDEATARSFSTGAEFAQASAGVGLPTPRIEYLGDVSSVIAKPALVR